MGGSGRPAIPAPVWRSGRIPALPYPPHRCVQYSPLLYKTFAERTATSYNYSCSGSLPLAGFEVITYGRIWGDYRGWTKT